MKETVLITGAGRGIGAACAEIFAKNGYRVAINYFKSEKKAKALSEKIQQFGGVAEIFYADISNCDDVKKMREEIENKFESPKILINNAGISQQKLFTDITLKDWDDVFNINTKGVFICCKEFLPSMIKKKHSKAAVIGLSKALAKEVALSKITVNCLAPGVIATDMMKTHSKQTIDLLKQEIACGEIGRAEDVANAALFLASDEASYITGQVINVDGGF